MRKSEGNAMNKDRECLQSMIQRRIDNLPSGYEGLYIDGSRDAYELVLQDIDQLEELEVLSQEWIDKHKESRINNLRKRTVSDVVPVDKLQDLLVPKQELPVIPKYVADYIDGRKEVGFPIYQAIRIVRENSRFKHSHLREWLSTNKGQETFARAWLDGYEVEEEQKYFVSSRESAGFWFLSKNNDNEVIIGTNKDYYDKKWESLKLTEQEIKDYDPRYFSFAVKVGDAE